ncbi:MAG: T9SS type A sorting domain-containing protein [Ignavibacteriae bacterium]|nr:T9SS type A sorting domain-containing protein [Ignavibacteriota bacterium]
MKKLFLICIILIYTNLFASVDIRLSKVDNQYNTPSPNKGTLIIDIEGMSNSGDIAVVGFQNSIQLDATFQGQNPSASFTQQLFLNTSFLPTELYKSGTGVIEFTYSLKLGGTPVNLADGVWTKIVRISIVYDMADVNGMISWTAPGILPTFQVLNTSAQNIAGNEGTIPSELQTVPLPVELSSFNVNAVEGTKAQLNWETATEVNNYGFEIERSLKSETEESAQETEVSWEKVAFVEGHGNSNSPKLYSFTDKNLIGGSKFLYRLKQIDIDGTFEYSEAVEIEVLPIKYELMQNYPNPFNPTTNIKFSLPEDAKVSINIYNILGEKVASLLNEDLLAGFHQVDFNAFSSGYQLASGIYLYSIESKNFKQVKKMMLMK